MTDKELHDLETAFAGGRRTFNGVRCDDVDAAIAALDGKPLDAARPDGSGLDKAARHDTPVHVRDLIESGQQPVSYPRGSLPPQDPRLDDLRALVLAIAGGRARVTNMPKDIHRRLAAALGGTTLMESLPPGVHHRLVHGAGRTTLPAGIHRRLAEAIGRPAHVTLSPDVPRRLAHALIG